MPNSPFGFEKPEDSPGFLLWQTTITWQRLIKKTLEPFDISHPQFVIMAILLWFEQHHLEITQGVIVSKSKLDKMTVSKSLKKLIHQGLVNRSEHEIDTRTKSVTLTAQGKALIQQLGPLVEKMDSVFFSHISPIDQKALIHILGQLVSKTD